VGQVIFSIVPSLFIQTFYLDFFVDVRLYVPANTCAAVIDDA
jgi:hypothetical protein